MDLGWSPDDTQLASCSLDNTVRIWQASTGAPLAVLSGHESLVKGLTWDPIGFFLATQSDDKSVIIWRTNNWTMVKKVEGPWEKTVSLLNLNLLISLANPSKSIVLKRKDNFGS